MNVTPYSSETARYQFLFLYRQVNQALVSAAFFVFDPEDGGGMVLRNIRLSPKYTALQPRSSYSYIFKLYYVTFCLLLHTRNFYYGIDSVPNTSRSALIE
jgi:hypothetical protein